MPILTGWKPKLVSSSRSRRSAGFVPTWTPHRRPLYTLTDQGAPRALNLSDFGIGGRDRSWNTHAQNFIAANRPQLSAIAVEPELVAERNSIGLNLRPNGIVGAVPLRTPDTRKVVGGVVVHPRFGWEGIGPLLETVGWSAQPQILALPLVPGSARDVPPWVLAGPVLQRLGALLKDLRRGFRMREAIRETPRGQILWPRYATTQIPRGGFHHLPCRYPDLGPDVVLRSYLRWGIEAVNRSLTPYAFTDMVARRLSALATQLVQDLRDTPACLPERGALEILMRGTGLPSVTLARGLEALGWVVDERGLAGKAETEGLAWSLPMHELFERWVEHIARAWAHGIGAELRSGHAAETIVPLQWPRSGFRSLSSLIPDLVVRHGGHVYVIDAKYKGYFQELTVDRWIAVANTMREEHRHDVHQVLAYAALYEAQTVTSVLVYPMHTKTWERLAKAGRTAVKASITAGGRTVELVLAGLPLRLPQGQDVASVVRTWTW